MTAYYIRIATYGTGTPHIIDEEQMYQAERGMNYLNPEEFMFHCEADCMHDAKQLYWEEFSQIQNDAFAEAMHR